MTSAYWGQWTKDEIGLEDEIDIESEEDSLSLDRKGADEYDCYKCDDKGCSYCLDYSY